MTTDEAVKLVVQPTGTFQTAEAICVVDMNQKHRVAWLLDGLRKTEPTGPAFDKPGPAARLADALNGGGQ